MRVAAMTAAVAVMWVGAACAQTDQMPTEQLSGSNQLLTHDCGDGENLALVGSGNRISLTGACQSIAITGSGNTINALQPLNVRAIGNNNRVTWPKAPAEPHLHFEGDGNSAGPQKG